MAYRLKDRTYVDLLVASDTTQLDVAVFLNDPGTGATVQEFRWDGAMWSLAYSVPGKGQYSCNGTAGAYLRLERDPSGDPARLAVSSVALAVDRQYESITTPVMQQATATTGPMAPGETITLDVAWPTPFADSDYACFLTPAGSPDLVGAVSLLLVGLAPAVAAIAIKANTDLTGAPVTVLACGYGMVA